LLKIAEAECSEWLSQREKLVNRLSLSRANKEQLQLRSAEVLEDLKGALELNSSDVFLIINFSKDLGELKAAVDRDIEVIQLDMKKIEAGLNDAVKNKMKYAALKEREIKALLLKQSLQEEERVEEWVSSDFR
tara:strand:- start:28 stop:426 length:399 start_codon:yes stop_codon:yes gene_type:complete